MAITWDSDSTGQQRASDLPTNDVEGDAVRTVYTNIWEDQRVLNLEGDSFNGLFALYVLDELMRMIGEQERQIQPDATSVSSPLYRPYQTQSRSKWRSRSQQPENNPLLYRPCHYFDYIFGTSFGGTCAIMLGVMRFTVGETIERTEAILLQLQPKMAKSPLHFATRARRANSDSLEHQLRRVLEDRTSENNARSQSATSSRPSASLSQSELAKMRTDEYGCQT